MKPSLGLFFALSSAVSYGLMSFLVHLNPGKFPPEQLVFIRSAIAFGCLLPFCQKDLYKYFRSDSKFLWIRSVAGAAGLVCYFYTLQGTVSANANFLFASSPIFVGLLSWALFGERTTTKEALGIALIIVANVLLYLPNRGTIETWVWVVGGTGALLSSVSFLSLGVATKIYSSSLIVIGFAAASMLLAVVMPSAPWKNIQPSDYTILLAISLLGLFSQLTATLSFAHLKSSVATALGRSSILFSGLLDMAIAGYRPHWLEWTSYLLVVVGIYFSQMRAKKVKVLLK